jgi:predicted dehydrogenase
MTKPGTVIDDPTAQEPIEEAAHSSEQEAAQVHREFPAPELPYQPQDPPGYRPPIALIGCGAIAFEHLRIYAKAGYDVAALCDVQKEKAEQRRAEFYPEADVYDDIDKVLARDDIEVVDITTHPEHRYPLVQSALLARKHVLSQKPFVENLDRGEQLCDLAEKQGVLLAVNQNGRWAPHFSYMRLAVKEGYIGEVSAAHLAVHWDHGWVEPTPFNKIRHLILYDFGIHWFDIVNCFMQGQLPRRIFASFAHSRTQTAAPALLAQALIEYEQGQSSIVFDGDTRFGAWDTTYVTGSQGTLISTGSVIKEQQVELYTKDGVARPTLVGKWFPDGFHGAMAELLSAIADGREPVHNCRNNLHSLALCFAAVASAESNQPIVPGTVRSMPK